MASTYESNMGGRLVSPIAIHDVSQAFKAMEQTATCIVYVSEGMDTPGQLQKAQIDRQSHGD